MADAHESEPYGLKWALEVYCGFSTLLLHTFCYMPGKERQTGDKAESWDDTGFFFFLAPSGSRQSGPITTQNPKCLHSVAYWKPWTYR